MEDDGPARLAGGLRAARHARSHPGGARPGGAGVIRRNRTTHHPRVMAEKKVGALTRAQRLALVERDAAELPVTVQADLLNLNRTGLYYHPVAPSAQEVAIKHAID